MWYVEQLLLLFTFDSWNNSLRETQDCCELWTPVGSFSRIFPFLSSQELQISIGDPCVSMKMGPFPRSEGAHGLGKVDEHIPSQWPLCLV